MPVKLVTTPRAPGVPPTPSHLPSGLAATENAGHRFVGATSSPLSTSHTRTFGAPELANRSGAPAITAIVWRLGHGSKNDAQLQAVIDDLRGEPVLLVDTRRAEVQLEQIPWIERAFVSTDFPNRVLIDVRERLPLATGSVQTLVSSWTLCSIPDVQGALAEIRRVLDPVQGRFHFVEHGLAPEPRLARWQHRLTPVQRVVADGCHLDRDMPALLRGAGLVLEVCEQFWVPGLPRLGAYMTLGRARVG